MRLSLLEAGPKPKKKKEYKAAVAVVRCRDAWLLGLAKDTGDDRTGYWVCPGGGTKTGETPSKTAVREAKEEAGIRCTAHGVFEDSSRKGVAFVACKASPGQKPTPNHEFVTLAWFTKKEMKGLRLYRNVENLINKAKQRC
jgi:8-oxo-dGTP pyrophosphatase MutT (NUDIX family)